MQKSNKTDMSPMFDGRICHVIDGVISSDMLGKLEATYASLPYRLEDSDREDTQATKHLVHRFPKPDRVVEFVASRARTSLKVAGQDAGAISRAYVNMNLFGDHQFAHVDGDEWTALLFLCATWRSDWGGELLIYPDQSDESLALAILPVPGRLVVFDGNLLHRGGCPTKRCERPRMTLAVKFNRAGPGNTE